MHLQKIIYSLILIITIAGCSKKDNPAPPQPVAPTNVEISNFQIASKYIEDADFSIPLPISNSPADFTYSSDNEAVATVKGNLIHITGAGTANITVKQDAAKGYTAGLAKASFTVLPNVYISGSSYENGALTGVYWKNGSINKLTGNAIATDIFVQGKDIYIAGSMDGGMYYRPGYWKNGVQHLLTSGLLGETSSIAVSGTDVYIVGITFKDTNPTVIYPTIWKNDKIISLPNPLDASIKAIPSGVVIYNNKPYIFGRVTGTNGLSSPIVWNGDGSVFKIYKDNAYAVNSMFFQGNDLYICGSVYAGNHYLVYWKNDVANSTVNGTANDDAYKSMTVVGSDVYIAGINLAGGIYTASYWKNGLETELAKNAIASKIVSQGKDVYIAGTSYLSYTYYDYVPVYWLNGNMIKLSGSTGTNTTSIMIVDHK